MQQRRSGTLSGHAEVRCASRQSEGGPSWRFPACVRVWPGSGAQILGRGGRQGEVWHRKKEGEVDWVEDGKAFSVAPVSSITIRRCHFRLIYHSLFWSRIVGNTYVWYILSAVIERNSKEFPIMWRITGRCYGVFYLKWQKVGLRSRVECLVTWRNELLKRRCAFVMSLSTVTPLNTKINSHSVGPDNLLFGFIWYKLSKNVKSSFFSSSAHCEANYTIYQ